MENFETFDNFKLGVYFHKEAKQILIKHSSLCIIGLKNFDDISDNISRAIVKINHEFISRVESGSPSALNQFRRLLNTKQRLTNINLFIICDQDILDSVLRRSKYFYRDSELSSQDLNFQSKEYDNLVGVKAKIANDKHMDKLMAFDRELFKTSFSEFISSLTDKELEMFTNQANRYKDQYDW